MLLELSLARTLSCGGLYRQPHHLPGLHGGHHTTTDMIRGLLFLWHLGPD